MKIIDKWDCGCIICESERFFSHEKPERYMHQCQAHMVMEMIGQFYIGEWRWK